MEDLISGSLDRFADGKNGTGSLSLHDRPGTRMIKPADTVNTKV
jgi:hypothetical protein